MGLSELIPFLGCKPFGDINQKLAESCHYFPLGSWLPCQLQSISQIISVGNRGIGS